MKKAVLAMFLTLPVMVWGASWEFVASDSNNETNFKTFEIDVSSVIKRDGLVRVWTRTSFRPERELAGVYPAKMFSSYMSLEHYDCEAKEATFSQSIYYSKTFGEGENLYSISNPKDTIKSSLEAVPPGTFLEAMLKRACAIANKQRK